MGDRSYPICPADPTWQGNNPLAVYSFVELVGGDVSLVIPPLQRWLTDIEIVGSQPRADTR
jgi:hypothetical protein